MDFVRFIVNSLSQARFAASTDPAFKAVGGHTKIQYQLDYEFYLKYLHDGLQRESPSVLEIFKEWNAVFYGNVSGAVSNNVSEGMIDEGLDDIMAEIHNEATQEGPFSVLGPDSNFDHERPLMVTVLTNVFPKQM